MAPPRNRSTIVITLLVIALFGMLASAWVLTGRISSKSYPDPDVYFGEPPLRWPPISCRRIAIIVAGGESAARYAQELRAAWPKDKPVEISILPEGYIDDQPVDVFICLGEPERWSIREGMRWWVGMRVSFSIGNRPCAFWPVDMQDHFDQIKGDWCVDGRANPRATRWGMMCEPVHAPQDFASSLIPQVSAAFSPTDVPRLPGECVGRISDKVEIPAVSLVGGKLIWQGPGVMEHQRTFWNVITNRGPRFFFSTIARALSDDGWHLEFALASIDDSTFFCTAYRGDEYLEMAKHGDSDVILTPWALNPGQWLYSIKYTRRFTDTEAQTAIQALFDQGANDKQLSKFQQWMSDEQKQKWQTMRPPP